MLYHLWKVPGEDMTGLQKLEHAIRVRNRHLGPVKGTCISPHLDVEMSADNKKMLELQPEDLNMYKVLRDCNVKYGERRKVAKRALTMLGNASGMCGQLNGPAQMKEIKACLEFAASLEEIKAAEVARKKRNAEKKKRRRQRRNVKRLKKKRPGSKNWRRCTMVFFPSWG